MTEQPATVPARVVWPQNHPVLRNPVAINQTVVQISPGVDGTTPDLVLVAFGFLTGPMFVGEVAEQNEQVLNLAAESDGVLSLVVEPMTRVAMTVGVAERLHAALGEIIERFNKGRTEASE